MGNFFSADPKLTQLIPDEVEVCDNVPEKEKFLLQSHLLILNRCSSDCLQSPIHLIYAARQDQFSPKLILNSLIWEACTSMPLYIPNFFELLQNHFKIDVQKETHYSLPIEVLLKLYSWFNFQFYLKNQKIQNIEKWISLEEYYQEGVIFLKSLQTLSEIKCQLNKLI